MRIGSLFSGAGGLDLAVEEVFGGEVIWQAEIDKAASKVLAYRFPCAPNLGDITAIDWKTVETPDVLCGGFPCQDVSAAGRRAGIKDGTRSGLWSVFADAIDQLRPPFVVIENVRGLLSATAHRTVESDDPTVGDGSDRPVLRALGAVLGDLSDLGYDAQWTTVAASAVGAPHRRERVFVVASDTSRLQSERWGRHGDVAGTSGISEGTGEERQRYGDAPDDSRAIDGRVALLPTPCAQQSGCSPEDHLRKKPGRKVVTDLAILLENGLLESGGALLPTPTTQDGSNCGGPSQFERNTLPLNAEVMLLSTPQSRDYKGVPADNFNNANLCRDVANSSQWGKYEPAIRRWESLTRPAPSPTEPNKNRNPRLSAAFSEWMMGWPAGWVTDPDIGISRNDQLKIIGNGVCPQQAIAALRYLLTVSEVAA